MPRMLSQITGCTMAMLLLFALATPSAGAKEPIALESQGCTQARDPERCAARLMARRICTRYKGDSLRQCMEDRLPEPNCMKARRPQRCAALVKARQACRGKPAAERRICLQAQRTRPARIATAR